jgi:hypothetical protein
MLLQKITADACHCLHGFKPQSSSAIFRSALGPHLFLLGWYYYEVLKTYLDISSLQLQCWGNLDDSVSLQKWNYGVFIFGGSGVLCKSYKIQSLQLCSILYRKMCGCNHSPIQALSNACMCTFCSWLQMTTSLLHFVQRLGDCIPLCTQHGELAAVDKHRCSFALHKFQLKPSVVILLWNLLTLRALFSRFHLSWIVLLEWFLLEASDGTLEINSPWKSL